MTPAGRAFLGVTFAFVVSVAGQRPTLGEALSRLRAYLEEYERRLSSVVAEERYRQSVDIGPKREVVIDRDASVLPLGHQERWLASDYALTRAADKAAWVGYRDTFEVDGKPVRDRDDRLRRLLTEGSPAAGARIAQESSRFNLANTIVERNVNVPTLVLEMLHPRNQSRFSLNQAGEETIAGRPTWRLDFKERDRPTFIRNTNGRDRPSRGSVWIDASTGEVWRTLLTWDSQPSGTITVTYGHVANIDALVPLTMTERYDAGEAVVTGDATYSNYRQFQTGARLLTVP